jgi:putative thioredoxin
MQPAEQLRRWLDSLLSATAGKLSGSTGPDEPVDPALQEARRRLDAGDLSGAAAAYQQLLDADPSHAEAKGALRQIRFLERATTRPADAIAVADAAPGDVEAAFAAADVQLLKQEIGAAFDRLIGLVRRTAGDDRTTVRTRLIELLELFDAADPLVIKARRDLSNALY